MTNALSFSFYTRKVRKPSDPQVLVEGIKRKLRVDRKNGWEVKKAVTGDPKSSRLTVPSNPFAVVRGNEGDHWPAAEGRYRAVSAKWVAAQPPVGAQLAVRLRGACRWGPDSGPVLLTVATSYLLVSSEE